MNRSAPPHDEPHDASGHPRPAAPPRRWGRPHSPMLPRASAAHASCARASPRQPASRRRGRHGPDFAPARRPASTRRLLAASTALVAVLAAALLAAPPARAATACSARSAATAPAVIELYTSEGCSSCPPADRWLSRRGADPAVVALAFHVDYWDRLGWTDRFARPAYTQRQAQQQATSGARFSYTPQVIVDGVDRGDWARLDGPPASRAAAPVALRLVRDGSRVTATVDALPGAPHRLAGYWAVTESGFESDVTRGENGGATLHHDFVVRDYRPLAGWAVQPGAAATTLQLDLPPADPAHPREVALVIVDAATGRPVQALRLGC